MSDDARAVELLLEEAEGRRYSGDLRGAIEALKRALGLEPDHAQAHGQLALCLLGPGRLHAAEHEARVAVSLDPEEPVARFALAATAFR